MAAKELRAKEPTAVLLCETLEPKFVDLDKPLGMPDKANKHLFSVPEMRS